MSHKSSHGNESERPVRQTEINLNSFFFFFLLFLRGGGEGWRVVWFGFYFVCLFAVWRWSIVFAVMLQGIFVRTAFV